MSDCVFCPRNWPNLDIAEWHGPGRAIINPLNPVTEGHLLVIDSSHSSDAADNPGVAAELMRTAASYVKRTGIQANLITSIGPAATQTVLHTHLHIVPRREGDGLPLPWTPQQHAQRFGPGPHLLTARDGSQALCGGLGVCPACDKEDA